MSNYPCRSGNPDDWFASPGTEVARRAKQACFQYCPIANDCAAYAIDTGIPFGIWGGVDEKERERIWAGKPGGKPSKFMDELDAALAGAATVRRDQVA